MEKVKKTVIGIMTAVFFIVISSLSVYALDENVSNKFDTFTENIGAENASGETLASTIVSKADSYVGKLEYVSGGTSLTSGVDCSGFVCAIYELYGYNLWGYRTKLKSLPSSIATNVGTNINNALPGDIIVYSGHVGIYAGSNLLINAANPDQDVVKKNYSYYGSVVAIMRVNGVVQSLSGGGSTNPVGIFEFASGGKGEIEVAGWAFQPDVDESIEIHFYIGDTFIGGVTANQVRGDVRDAYGCSEYVGFSGILGTDLTGTQSLQ